MYEFTSSIPGLDVRELDLDVVILGCGPDDADFNDDLGPCFE
jgi:hypothetical protein